MKTFEDYVRFREAMVADDDRNHPEEPDDEVLEMLISLMKEAWIDDPNIVLAALSKLDEQRPGKYAQRINELKKRKNNPFGKGLDKPDDPEEKFHHDVLKPTADRVGDPMGQGGGGGGGQ